MKESSDRTTSNRIGKVLSINPDPEIVYILEVNLAHANLEVISTQSGQEALTEIYKDKPDIIVLDPALQDIDGVEFCQKLKEAEYTRHIPVVLITDKAQRNTIVGKIVNGDHYYITKPFNPKDIVDLVLTYLKQKERMKNLNPLTGLPNEIQVSSELTRLIQQKKTFAAIYIAMNDLRSFNKVYGYDQGDRTIKLLADIIIDAVRLFGNSDDVVCHLGGDKFVVISSPWKARPVCRRIIADFNRRIRSLYTDQHLQRGYITYDSPIGIEDQSPIMNLRIAVITNQDRTFYHHLEVSEAAAEQMHYLKRFPERTSFFNYQESDINSIDMDLPNRMALGVSREEIRALYEVLAWLDFIVNELNTPITGIKDSLDSFEQSQAKELSLKQQESLNIIRGNIEKLNRIIEGFTDLARAEWLMAGASLDEVNIGDVLDWIIRQQKDITEEKCIRIDIEGVESIDKLLIDRKKLTQCLLYVLRGEIQSSLPEDRLHVLVAAKDKEYVNIQLINPNHYITQKRLSMLLRGQQEGVQSEALRNQLYAAKLLAEALGGELGVVSTKTKGTLYTITLPRKWQSIVQESNALQLAVDISRREARTEIRNIKRQLSLFTEEVPPIMTEILEKLYNKVQELGVLCNRSLFLADDFRNRLDIQQDRLLRQEVEQVASLEAIVIICQEIARAMSVNHIFELSNAKTVAKFALAIAKEMKLSDSDNRNLYNAALLKDLGLVMSPSDMIEQMVVNDVNKALSIKKTFNNIWQALSLIPYLSQTLNIITYRYEGYNDVNRSLNAAIDNIPQESRILAVSDTFESMISGRPPYEKLPLKLAVQNIVDNSGRRFDPHVVKTLLMLWKNNEFENVLSKSS